MILNCSSRLIKNYLAKGFYIIEKDSNQLSTLPNDVKLIINLIDQMDADFFMAKNKAISSLSNKINKLHIQKNMHLIYKQDYYKDKQEEIYDLFIEYLFPIMDDIDHSVLID